MRPPPLAKLSDREPPQKPHGARPRPIWPSASASRELFDLFDVAWDRLERSHVELFLDDAGEEGVNWEAKGAGKTGEGPRPDSLRKAACGLANQVGGYLIVGAQRADGVWRLDGIPKPADEPALWLGQILRRLQPVPRFEVAGPFDVREGRVALVARIEPVSISPCMTPQGRIYERVSGETLPVEDPVLLERLFRRGEQARDRSEQFARRAADRAIEIPNWGGERSISICLGLASVGREDDDIASRLFTASMHDLLVKGIWELNGEVRPIAVDVAPTQDSYVATIETEPGRRLGPDQGTVTRIIRASHFIQANWDGSVAAGVWSADDFSASSADPEVLVSKFWKQAARVGAELGGYGPAHLTVVVMVAEDGPVQLGVLDRVVGRPPPRGTIYASLPPRLRIDRYPDTATPDDRVIESIARELKRASGERADEPAEGVAE